MAPHPSPPWRALKAIGVWLAALLILFEEWGWMPLARALGVFARLPLIGWIERRIAALAPRWALLVFCVPMLMLVPIKIGAWWLIGRGKTWVGALILVLAKVLGTAVVGRLFLLTRPQLMRLPWFARWYGRWLAWKLRTLARVRASPLWCAARDAMAQLRAAARGR
jgi:hypothetical protein